MVVYIVDYENVKDDGLDAIQQIKKEDKVIIFYSGKTPKISIDTARQRISKAFLEILLTNALIGCII